MALKRLLTPPSRDSYSLNLGQDAILARLDGPFGRIGGVQRGGSMSLSAKWLLKGYEYWYFCDFYKVLTSRGSMPFLIDLVGRNQQLTRHVARFTPGSLSRTALGVQVFEVTATLEVSQQPVS